MAGSAPEYRQGSGGMEKVGKTYATVGGGHPGVRSVLQGGDTGGTSVRFKVMGAVRRNNGGSGEHPRGVPNSDHKEAGYATGRQGTRDTVGSGSTMGSGDTVIGQVHIHSAGNGGAMVGPTPNLGGVRVGYRLQGRSHEEMTVVDNGDNRGGAEEKYGRGIPGGDPY